MQMLVLAVPIMFWDDIKNETIKFTLALFILIFYGYTFFRIMEKNLDDIIHEGEQDYKRKGYSWLGLIMQAFLLVMFFLYSKNILELLH